MPPHLRAPQPAKRRRYDDDENEPSDSELSDIEDDPDETSSPDKDEDDDDDEADEDEEEESSDSDTPEGDAEESYMSEDVPDASEDDEDDEDIRPKALAKATGSRVKGGSRRTSTAKSAAIAKPPPGGKKVGKRVAASSQRLRQIPPRTTQTRSLRTLGTRSSYQQASTANKPPLPKKAPTVKLKIGRERLREVTAKWTPPLGGTDTGDVSTAAATPESFAPAPTLATSMPRGRKVVQEDSDEEEEEEEEEDDDKMDEDQDPDDELGDEDAEGETDDEMLDSDDDTGGTPGTDFGTPDLSRLTNRQRTKLGGITTADLLELPSGYEKIGANKVAVTLSAQEQELKRAEMARRRKNLTDQKLEEEKMDTINRLLKKQTPKMRGRGRATGDATPADGGDLMGNMEAPPPPTMVRFVYNKDGVRMAVPESWLAAPVGKVFQPQTETESMRSARRKMVEEIG